MRTFVLACFLVASASAAFIPSQSQQRQRRDVSELAYSYLPPEQQMELTTELPLEAPLTEAVSAGLGENGYEYRTVRRLKYRLRQRRDVSHLAQQYLPPNNLYLPPAAVPEMDDSEVVQAPLPKVANEYLPPVAAEEVAATTEAPAAPAETEAPAVREAEQQPEMVVDVVEDMPQDTAILAMDGYHYKQPETEEPALLKVADDTPSVYLPPLDEAAVVEDVGPAESAVLADDGYHYRAVKRFRF